MARTTATRPNVAAVNCALLGPDGTPAQIERPMNDAEYAQWQTDQADAAAAAKLPPPPPAPTPLSTAIDALETLDQTKAATIGDVVAALKLIGG